MSFGPNVEEVLRDAIERGEFDDLKGKGQPINLDAYFATPEHIRMAHSILKSNDYVPEVVWMINEIAELREKVAAASNEKDAAQLRRRLNERELALRLAIERNKRKFR